MEYKLAATTKLVALSVEVNKLIREGWRPQGGIAVAGDNSGPIYVQAMIRP